MNNPRFTPAPSQIYRHHWLAYWKPIVSVAVLLPFSVVGFSVLPELGLALLILALIVAVSTYYHWSWHTLTLTRDGRLVYCHGLFATRQDIISLFGMITPHQTPILGPLLNVGSLYLGIPGPDSHIHYIANFRTFRTQLLNGTAQAESRSDLYPQVVIHMPPSPYEGVSQPKRLPPGDLPPSSGSIRVEYTRDRRSTSDGHNGRKQ